jgi:PPOX class probable F420-dependent enzyme
VSAPDGRFLRSLPGNVVEFVRAPRHAVIATHEDGDEIRQAVVWYDVAADAILMNALQSRHWSANLRRDPRMSMTVFDGEDYVILRGTAAVVDDPERALEEAMALARRYGGDPDVHLGQHRIRILFTPEHVALHGGLASGQR